MTTKAIKEEARRKLALNMHQAIIVYTVMFAIFITLLALIVMSCVCLNYLNFIACVVMICYGVLLCFLAMVGMGMVSFAMTDFYLAGYRCKPYNIRRLGETIARGNITKILLIALRRTAIACLLLMCLIVPGVIYLIRTSMAYFLLIANPKMKPSTALNASGKIMSGKTGAYFSLCVSLIGWHILGVATLGLGAIFIMPYTKLIKTVFYKRILQGDKTVYTVPQQPVSPMPVVTNEQAPPMRQANVGQTSTSGEGQGIAETGYAPIDTLAEEDLIDMNAAMSDFGGGNIGNVQDVPEVALAGGSAAVRKDIKKAKGTKEANGATGDSHMLKEHRIDGTGLVETERTLTTSEINASDLIKRQAIEHMYSNTDTRAANHDYFTGEGVGSKTAGFADDFGTQPDSSSAVGSTAVGDEQLQLEPIMSESEFDDFLRMFDNEPSTENSTSGAGAIAAEVAEVSEAAEVTPSHKDDSSGSPRFADRHTERADVQSLRRSPAERQQEIAERAERLRREREQRLKK